MENRNIVKLINKYNEFSLKTVSYLNILFIIILFKNMHYYI